MRLLIRAGLPFLLLTGLLAGQTTLAAPKAPQASSQPAQGQAQDLNTALAGTYKIDKWESLEAKGMFQFFYLHPNGTFLLGSEWAGYESARFAGTWSLAGDSLELQGSGWVNTNKGNWKTEYTRTFTVTRSGGAIRLKPYPAKNHFGMLGWPSVFTQVDTNPKPNLPGQEIPAEASKITQTIESVRSAK